jgi:ketosteroid isomerase-like protein
MFDRLQGGLAMTVKGAIAEGDKAAPEVQSGGDLANGRQHRQDYHFLIEFRDGRICAVGLTATESACSCPPAPPSRHSAASPR